MDDCLLPGTPSPTPTLLLSWEDERGRGFLESVTSWLRERCHVKGHERTLSHRLGVAARRGPPIPQLDKQETCYLHCAYQIREGENGQETARQKEAFLRHFCLFHRTRTKVASQSISPAHTQKSKGILAPVTLEALNHSPRNTGDTVGAQKGKEEGVPEADQASSPSHPPQTWEVVSSGKALNQMSVFLKILFPDISK